MKKEKRFFCAECETVFLSTYVEIPDQFGRITLLPDIDACPCCGGRAIYTDDAGGHADEIRAALDYEASLYAAELDEDDNDV